ncbi:hypothetical protein ND810_01270 [Leptospira levettii]|uniref:Uncharacterized protein n=1 Tax=Leptospira levettii TaxID=2023178 RepID=A0AAW5V7N6_9LEPT|nr:hypothetical protein [Leptospira levettii]
MGIKKKVALPYDLSKQITKEEGNRFPLIKFVDSVLTLNLKSHMVCYMI